MEKSTSPIITGSRVHPADEMSISAISYGGPGMSKMAYSELGEATSSRTRSKTLEEAKYSDMRKKAGLSRFPTSSQPQGKNGRPVELDWQEEMLRVFVRENFHQKECTYFVPKPNQKVKKNRDLKCHCGEILRFHAGIKVNAFDKNIPISESFLVPGELKSLVDKEYDKPPDKLPEVKQPWNANSALQPSTTSSFGKISFEVEQIGGQKPAKYVRVSNEDDVPKVLELMKKIWRIMEPKPPNLVISVVGGAKNFRLDGRMRDTFSNGLIKAAKTTSAWLITSGFNMGVMKAVGQAVHEGQTFLWDDDRMTHLLRCIGIAPWGYIRGRHVLESSDGQGSFNASYRPSNVILHGRPVPLNPDHTHFIFVDDGYRNRYGGVADFRAKFEKHISMSKDGGLGIPVVLIVVEGGTDALQDAKRSLEEGTPVVVCAGTGRAADILAYAYKHVSLRDGGLIIKSRYRKKISQFIFKSYGKGWSDDKKDDELKKYLDIVVDCVTTNEDLMYVFHMNKHEDLDLAILSVLLKAKKDKSTDTGNRLEQLNLALTWNRADIAQREIFREDVNWDAGKLEEVLTKALLEDKVDFIKLLLNQGVVMKEYLTVKRLEDLYSKIPKNTHLFRLLKRETGGKEKFTLKDIGKYLKSLLDKFDDDKYLEKPSESAIHKIKLYHQRKQRIENSKIDLIDQPDTDGIAQFTCPYKQLLIWSVLMNRQQMSVFFWEMGQEPITSAIVATRLCGIMTRKIPKYENDLREEFESSKQLFEELAIKVLDECHLVDPDISMLLVKRKSPNWSKMTCLQIAASAQDQAFLSSVGCQYSINNTWKLGILSSWRRVLLAVFFPLVIFSRFMELSRMGEQKFHWFHKASVFYTAPITKFTVYTLSYLIFLCLYSYMVLVDFMPTPSVSEWICFIWIITFLIGEIHTFLAFPSPTFYGKIRDWYGFLNRLDLANLILSIIAFIIRWNAQYVFIAKTIYCISAVVFYLRIMRVYTANSSLGPKLFMILKMFEELILFCLVLGVFLLAYGVASQGLLYYSRKDLSFNVVIDVFYYPYWQLYGEIFLDEIQTDDTCNSMNNVTNVESFSNPCRTHSSLVPILLAGYLLVGNVLLLNLLIAIFSHVFDTVEKKSLEIWKYQMYFLVSEYDVKTVIIPPFSVIIHIYLLIKWIFRKTCCTKQTGGVQYQPHHLMYLQLFEKEMMANYLRRKKASEMNNIDMKFSALQKRVDDLTKLIEDEMVAGDETDEEFQTLEPQDTMLNLKLPIESEPEPSRWPNPEEVIELGKREKELDDLLLNDVSKADEPHSQTFEDMVLAEVKKKHKKKKKKKEKKKRKENEEEKLRETGNEEEEYEKPKKLAPLSPPVMTTSPRSPKAWSFTPSAFPAVQANESESEEDVSRDKLGRRHSSKIKSRSSYIMPSDSSDDDEMSSRRRNRKLAKQQQRKERMYESKMMDVEERLAEMARSNQETLEQIKSLVQKDSSSKNSD